MANVVVSVKSYIDKFNDPLLTIQQQVIIEIDTKIVTACDASAIALSLDITVNFMEAATNGKTIYRYTPGDTFNNLSVADASAMFENIRQAYAII